MTAGLKRLERLERLETLETLETSVSTWDMVRRGLKCRASLRASARGVGRRV